MVAQKPRKKRWQRRILTGIFTFVLLAALLTAYAFSNLNPILIDMARARARQLAMEAINEAVSEVMGRQMTYSDLVNVLRDECGKVSMLQANTMLMNELASRAALVAQRNLEELADQGVELPLGAALGLKIFEGAGPKFRVRLVPVGWVTTGFVTAFEDAGINQTRHEISLEASTVVNIVIPTGAGAVDVSTYVPIAEGIIVGGVPESFVEVPDMDSMLNMAP